MRSEKYFEIAFKAAEEAAEQGEVPVGAVLVSNNDEILSIARNRMKELKDPTAHAEVLAIREACQKLDSERLPDADLYVTLEPCTMCATAISFARIRRLYFGAYDPKGGAIEYGARFFSQPTCHHMPEIYGGFQETRAEAMLKDFFKKLRT